MFNLREALLRSVKSVKFSIGRTANAALADQAPPFPVIASCPAPTCPCSSMPAGLDIDHKRRLNGTMSPYAQHLIVSTGRSDWTSRIEDERDTAVWGKFTSQVKALLGRGGEFHDPFNNILVSTSSFKPWELANREAEPQKQSGRSAVSVQTQKRVDALLFPAFQHFRSLDIEAESDTLRKLTKSSLLPGEEKLHPIYKDLSDSERRAKLRDPAVAASLDVRPIDTPTILICSHGQRDSRCGTLGPLLHAEFKRYMQDRGSDEKGVRLNAVSGSFATSSDTPSSSQSASSNANTSDTHTSSTVNINIGMISHIGGHKWAGNVIVYIPPTFTFPTSSASLLSGPLGHRNHPLAGMGIWYGRIEPRHVEGVVEQTLVQGKVIQDLFRGGISKDQGILRM